MGHLGQGALITTVEDKEIVLTSVDGQHFRMKVADLAEAVRQVMPVATGEKKGLMSSTGFIKRGIVTIPSWINLSTLDTVTDSGMYLVKTANGEEWGHLVVFNNENKTDGSIIQFLFKASEKRFSYRIARNNSLSNIEFRLL